MSEKLKPHTYFDKGRVWHNHHETIVVEPARYYDVWNIWDDSSAPEAHRWKPGFAALRQIVRDAEADRTHLRGFGGGWSLSPAVAVKKHVGFLLNTKPLNFLQIGLRREHCTAKYLEAREQAHQAPERRLVFAQCGVNIAELSARLESEGLSLPTSGASNGQTMVGAMSTGTHGAAVEVGSIQEYVVGLHIIGEGGEPWWLQRNSCPVVNQQFCDVLETGLRTDDRLFNAAVVSFGSFGIIHAVLLEAVPLFLLERHVTLVKYNDIRPALGSVRQLTLQLGIACPRKKTCKPFHLEVLVNPYACEAKDGAAFRHMYKRRPNDNLRQDCRRLEKQETLSNDAFHVMGNLVNLPLLKLAIPLAVTLLFKGQILPDNGTLLTHGGTFDSTKIPGNSVSCELGFALADVPQAMDIIIQEMKAGSFLGIAALRYVKCSKALLAFTKFHPTTCAIEILGPRTSSSMPTYMRIWRRLEREHIKFTYHWGQLLSWGDTPSASRKRIEEVFCKRYRAWVAARNQFLPNTGKRTFGGPFLEECGLS